MSTAILVLSVDEAPLLAHSLPLAAAQPGAALTVIDNASTDDTRAVAERAGARLIALPERLSYAAAMNAGLRAVLGASNAPPAVLLLNADCFLHPDFLARALPRLEDPAVGSVAPKLLRTAAPPRDPAAPPQPIETIDAAGMSIDRRRKNSIVGHGRSALRFTTPGEAFGPDGACALYRSEALRQLGPEWFDERMALWATDADLAWRARARGWRCAYEPAAIARHIRTFSPSTRAQSSREHRRIQFRNRLLMIARNETAAGLRHDAARIAAYELAALGHTLLRERFLLRGYAEAARALPATLARRRGDQRTALPPFGLEPPA